MRLQLALDLLDLDQALSIATAAAPSVDILAAGTPLIKQVGLRAVTALRERFPDKQILADLKTADMGDLEVSMAADAGADAVSILALASRETLVSALAEARQRGVRLVTDLIGVSDPRPTMRLLSEIGLGYAAVHCGIDEQRAGKNPFERLLFIAPLSELRLAVAGGLGPHNLPRLPVLPQLEVVIVGGAITRATNPGEAARRVAALVKREG